MMHALVVALVLAASPAARPHHPRPAAITAMAERQRAERHALAERQRTERRALAAKLKERRATIRAEVERRLLAE